MHIGLYVTYFFSGLIFMKFEFPAHIYEKYSKINFPENPLSGSRDVPCGQTGGRAEGRTDVTKLIVAF
jgi:hypothetical protein